MGMQGINSSILKSVKVALGCLVISGPLLLAQKTELKKDQKMIYPEYLISPNGKYTAELNEYGLCLCRREDNGTKTIMWKSNNEIVKEPKDLGELSIMVMGTGDLRVYSTSDAIWHHPANNRMVEDFDLRARIDDYGQIILEFHNNNVIWLQYGRINYKPQNSTAASGGHGGGGIRIPSIPPQCPIQ
jgi:hypothetical protein